VKGFFSELCRLGLSASLSSLAKIYCSKVRVAMSRAVEGLRSVLVDRVVCWLMPDYSNLS
jgi:hypothetical protein